jgi:hypothetical protein
VPREVTDISWPEPAKVPRNPRVKLLKQIKVDSAWVLAPALLDSKARIRRDQVMIAGRDEAHPEGSHFVEFWDRGQAQARMSGPMRSLPPIEPSIATPNSPPSQRPGRGAGHRRGAERTKISDALEKYTDYI